VLARVGITDPAAKLELDYLSKETI
jgi:hypothetical protein